MKIVEPRGVIILVLLVSLVVGSFVSLDFTYAQKTIATVTYDYYVVAGYNMKPTLPSPASSPLGFTFNCTPSVFDFGNITYWGGRTYLYEGYFGSNVHAFTVLNITNLLGYDITITSLTAEVTEGTPTKDFFFAPAGMWFGNWTMVWFDTLDPWNPVYPQDECDYYTGEVTVVRDEDWWTKAVREPCDAPTGPASLLEPDSNGDAEATGHVAPVQLPNGSTFTEYFGIVIFGEVDASTQINGTITLSLTYEYTIPKIPIASFTYSPTEIFVNETVTFDASVSTPNGGILIDPDSYVWDFGDGTTDTGMVVNHTYTMVGTYTVILNVTDSEGKWNYASKSIKVHPCTYVPLPFHYQINSYYCGPAAVEMVFDFYGEGVPQTEIADVARTISPGTMEFELRRAAHFSNLSTSLGDEIPSNITGYSARKIGYAAFEQTGLTIEDLKTLINRKEPLLVLMWGAPSKTYGHYRVVIGYNETHIIMHDPWEKDAWGGTYGGADTSMNYSTFLDLWEYSSYWGLWMHPWVIELQMPSTVSEGDIFEVTANITYPCSPPFNTADYPSSSCKASIDLQPGLELGLGETTEHSLGNVTAGDSVQTSWSIHAGEIGLHNVSVTATGVVEGTVWAHGNYSSYTYEDEIGGSFDNSLSVIPQAYTVHNINSGESFSTIQEAINDDATLDGDTILVDAGTYYESVVVNKSISLIGEDRTTTILDGNGTGSFILFVPPHDVTVTGFTARNAVTGFYVIGDNHTITGNIISNNTNGIWLNGRNNLISENTITNNLYGIVLLGYDHNILNRNMITKNEVGIYLQSSNYNKFHHNNLIYNAQQILSDNSTNVWDDGYPSGGNYWSDYSDADIYSGPYQNETGSDGVWDHPYIIDYNNQDKYPIVPEFPTLTPIFLMLIILTVAIAFYKRILPKTPPL